MYKWFNKICRFIVQCSLDQEAGVEEQVSCQLGRLQLHSRMLGVEGGVSRLITSTAELKASLDQIIATLNQPSTGVDQPMVNDLSGSMAMQQLDRIIAESRSIPATIPYIPYTENQTIPYTENQTIDQAITMDRGRLTTNWAPIRNMAEAVDFLRIAAQVVGVLNGAAFSSPIRVNSVDPIIAYLVNNSGRFLSPTFIDTRLRPAVQFLLANQNPRNTVSSAMVQRTIDTLNEYLSNHDSSLTEDLVGEPDGDPAGFAITQNSILPITTTTSEIIPDQEAIRRRGEQLRMDIRRRIADRNAENARRIAEIGTEGRSETDLMDRNLTPDL